jgi:NADPH2:quinone reductase
MARDNLRSVFFRHGPPEIMEMVQEEPGEPGPGEIRICVETAGVSPADLLICWGLHPESRRPPFTPGWDVIGIVDRIGPNAGEGDCAIGKRVAALTIVDGFARYVCTPASNAVPVPDGLDPAEAQCMPFDYAVAYQMMYRSAAVQPETTVLIQGAAGSTGSALLQLGRLLRLKMYGTASTKNCETVRDLGGILIDYRREDFVRVLREQEPGGVDVVFDGLGHTIARSFRVLSRDGTIVAYGHAPVVAGGRRHWGKLLGTVAQFAWVFGRASLSPRKARLYSIQQLKKKYPNWYCDDVSQLFRLLGEGAIKPRVFDRMPLEQVQEALELVSRSAVTGKIILFAQQ